MEIDIAFTTWGVRSHLIPRLFISYQYGGAQWRLTGEIISNCQKKRTALQQRQRGVEKRHKFIELRSMTAFGKVVIRNEQPR